MTEITQADRDLLAYEFDADGADKKAYGIRTAEDGALSDGDMRALRAIAKARQQGREAALREAAGAVHKRYMGDQNREDQEVLRCEKAILALIEEVPK